MPASNRAWRMPSRSQSEVDSAPRGGGSAARRTDRLGTAYASRDSRAESSARYTNTTTVDNSELRVLPRSCGRATPGGRAGARAGARPSGPARYWPTSTSGGEYACRVTAGSPRTVGDGMDVAGRPLLQDARAERAARCSAPRLGACARARTPWSAVRATFEAAVVVVAGRLARHPAQHPDVEALVLEHEPVAAAAAIGHDQRRPQIASPPRGARRARPARRSRASRRAVRGGQPPALPAR